VILHVLKVFLTHLAHGAGADSLVDVLDGDVAVAEAAGSDRAAVDDYAGNVQAQKRHRAGGDRLVAADDAH
jgi:hypothetical protein